MRSALSLSLGNPTVGLRLGDVPGMNLHATIAALSPIVWTAENDTSTMTIARDGNGSAPAVDGLVGRCIDQSGNDRHCIAEDDASRPTLKSHGGVLMPEYADDDTMDIDVSTATMSDVTVICLTHIPASDTSFILFNAGDGASSSFAACGVDGSSSGAHTTAVGVTSYTADGVDVGGTARSDLFDALADDEVHIFEMRGADLSGLGWTILEIGGFSTDAGAFRLAGSSVSNILILPTATYDSHRSSVILPYYSQLSGVSV